VTLRDKEQRSEIRKNQDVKPLLRIERSQLHWFSHASTMPQQRLARQVLLATPTEKLHRSHPRDQVAWLHLRTYLVPSWCWPREINIAVDRDAHEVLLRLLPSRFSPKEKWARKWVN